MTAIPARILLACSLLAACGVEERILADGGGPAEVRHSTESHGIARRLALVPGQRLCVGQHEPGCDFRDIDLYAITPNRSVILGSVSGLVQLFDSTGRHVRTIGGRGGGPGEYERPTALSVGRDGRIHVFDIASSRLLSYSASGEPEKSARLDLPASIVDVQLRGDQLVVLSSPPARAVSDSVSSVFLVAGSSAAAGDTILTLTTGATFVAGSEFMAVRPLFSPQPVWALDSRGGITYSDGASTLLTRYDDAGRAVRRVSGVAPVRPISRTDVARQREALRAALPPAARASMGAQIDQAAANAPRQYPTVGAIRVLDDGTLWLREWTTFGADSARWNVFDADGSWIGYTTLAGRSRLVGGDRESVLVIEHDALDVPSATWYRVR